MMQQVYFGYFSQVHDFDIVSQKQRTADDIEFVFHQDYETIVVFDKPKYQAKKAIVDDGKNNREQTINADFFWNHPSRSVRDKIESKGYGKEKSITQKAIKQKNVVPFDDVHVRIVDFVK